MISLDKYKSLLHYWRHIQGKHDYWIRDCLIPTKVVTVKKLELPPEPITEGLCYTTPGLKVETTLESRYVRAEICAECGMIRPLELLPDDLTGQSS